MSLQIYQLTNSRFPLAYWGGVVTSPVRGVDIQIAVFLTLSADHATVSVRSLYSDYLPWALHLFSERLSLNREGGERGRRPPLPEIVRSSYRRLQ